jgi:CheY-like chemotaxis protein
MKTILIIDDEKSIQKYTQVVLEREGFRVIAANDGRTGFELAKQNVPDLVICDIVMPEINGYQTLQLFKTDPKLASVRWVFLTGSADVTGLASQMNLGMEDFIPKPFSLSKLLAVISTKFQQ